MSDKSPLFFMREFSNQELSQLLVNKVKELKKAKTESEELNDRLQDTVAHLEELQAQLEQQNEELEYKVKEKTEQALKSERLATIGELSARIAHDLRNPLSILKSTVEVMRIDLEPTASERTTKSFARLERAISRISYQVEDVLDYLKPANLCVTKHSLLHILQDSIDRIDIPDNITIKIPKNDYSILCDNEKIETIFVNLVSNSMQTIEDNEGRIAIDFTQEDNSVIIKVSDNGPGIPENFIGKIFDPLFTTRQIGTGLGLPSCKNIAERHGGSMSVSSKENQGAIFTITLPIKSEFESVGKEISFQDQVKIKS